jgi:hypothetical protein
MHNNGSNAQTDLMEVFAMKRRWFSLVMVVVACLVLAGFSAHCEGASWRGNVVALSSKGTPACTAATELLPERQAVPCSLAGETSGAAAVEGTLPEGLEPGKTVILRTGNSGKIVATVIAVFNEATPLDDVAVGLAEKGANIIWRGDGGRGALFKTPEDFSLSVGDEIQMKAKSPRRRAVEGC